MRSRLPEAAPGARCDTLRTPAAMTPRAPTRRLRQRAPALARPGSSPSFARSVALEDPALRARVLRGDLDRFVQVCAFEDVSSWSSSFLPDRHVLAAAARERLSVPVAEALPQPHAGQARHQIELRRPDVAERRRRLLEDAVDGAEVVGDEPLAGEVVLVDADVTFAHLERVE